MKRAILTLCAILALCCNLTAQTQWELRHFASYPTGVLLDDNDSLWYFSQGVGFYELQGATEIDHGSGLTSIAAVCGDYDQGIFWLGGYGGAASYDPSTNTSTLHLNGETVYDIVAKQGVVYAALENSGLAIYNNGTWTYHNASTGLQGDWFTCVEVDDQGNIWLGSVSFASSGPNVGHVNYYDGSSWTNFSSAQGMTLTEVTGIFRDTQGSIWVGGNALTKYDGQTWTDFTVPNLVGSIYSIVEAANGNIWVSGISSNLYEYDGTSLVEVMSPSPFSGRPNGIAAAANGTLYVTLDSGIFSIREAITIGLSEQQKSKNAAFPNPATESLYVVLNDPDEAVVVLDALGKVCSVPTTRQADQATIDVSSLPTGIYTVVQDGKTLARVVVQ